jgi:peroxiredoxin
MNAPLLRRTCAAAILAAASLASGCAVMAEGRQAPPVTGYDWVHARGKSPSAPVKDRWTLIVVFRPGSQTCVDGMPDVLNMKKTYEKHGLAVVGVTAADREDTEAFIQENGIDFPVLADAEHVIDSYGIPAVDENYTYLVDPPGVIVAQCDLTSASRILDKYLRGLR